MSCVRRCKYPYGVPRDPDTLPTAEDPTGPCPRCGRTSSFQLRVDQALHPVRNTGSEPGHERAIVLFCMGCEEGTVVIQRLNGEWSGVHWWPVPGAGVLDPKVSPRVASAYDEGARCLAIHADRAAAVMFRAALAEIVTNKGSQAAQAKPHLHGQLAQMSKDGTLHPSLSDWAKEIKDLGNVGAHPNKLGDIGREDAVNLSHLTRRVIEFLYEVPARIDRSRSSRAVTP